MRHRLAFAILIASIVLQGTAAMAIGAGTSSMDCPHHTNPSGQHHCPCCPGSAGLSGCCGVCNAPAAAAMVVSPSEPANPAELPAFTTIVRASQVYAPPNPPPIR